jgi:hypothetical protein
VCAGWMEKRRGLMCDVLMKGVKSYKDVLICRGFIRCVFILVDQLGFLFFFLDTFDTIPGLASLMSVNLQQARDKSVYAQLIAVMLSRKPHYLLRGRFYLACRSSELACGL